MTNNIKLFAAFALLLSSHQFYAQDTSGVLNEAQHTAINNAKDEARKSSDLLSKKLSSEQDRLKKEQKNLAKGQKKLQNAEKDIQRSNKKIAKLVAENQKLSGKLEGMEAAEALKKGVKIKKNELAIQKLKSKLVDQESKLQKIKSDL